MIDLNDVVAEKLINCNSLLVDKLAQLRADQIIKERLDKLSKIYVNYYDLQSKLDKFKPDNVQYDIEGKVVTETYSKAKLDERSKLIKDLNKLTNLLNCLETNDFSQLDNYNGNN